MPSLNLVVNPQRMLLQSCERRGSLTKVTVWLELPTEVLNRTYLWWFIDVSFFCALYSARANISPASVVSCFVAFGLLKVLTTSCIIGHRQVKTTSLSLSSVFMNKAVRIVLDHLKYYQAALCSIKYRIHYNQTFIFV